MGTYSWMVRSMDRSVAERIQRAAAARGLTVPAYLAALVDLHDAVRARADAGDDGLAAQLTARGLQTVVI